MGKKDDDRRKRESTNGFYTGNHRRRKRKKKTKKSSSQKGKRNLGNLDGRSMSDFKTSKSCSEVKLVGRPGFQIKEGSVTGQGIPGTGITTPSLD